MPRHVTLPAGMTGPGFALLNAYQRGFPLVAAPFAEIAVRHGIDEAAVIATYRDWLQTGVVSRIGPVFAPRRLGASALVALRVPPERLDAVAARVSAETGVNHNYEREHAFNLWFVAAAPSGAALGALVADVAADTGCPSITLPLEEEFHIDLGFDLALPGAARCAEARPLPALDAGCAMPALERSLLGALQHGLPLEARPYAALGARCELAEGMVIECIERWLADGLLRRFGVVLRHHELGIAANAMCVWDVPDEEAGALGRALAAEPAVTLCYRRARALPHWRYNLFCMIHGSAREAVLAARAEIGARLGLDSRPYEVLFSRRRFKQRGACYLPAEGDACHA